MRALFCHQVYDVTDFLDDHPGGGESITISAGQDSSEEFNALHSDKARSMLEDYYIGDLDNSVAKPAVSAVLIFSSPLSWRVRAILMVKSPGWYSGIYFNLCPSPVRACYSMIRYAGFYITLAKGFLSKLRFLFLMRILFSLFKRSTRGTIVFSLSRDPEEKQVSVHHAPKQSNSHVNTGFAFKTGGKHACLPHSSSCALNQIRTPVLKH